MSQPTEKPQAGKAAAWTIAFLVLTPVILVQIPSELGQVLLFFVAALAFGYALGLMLSGRSRAQFITIGAAIGVLTWLALVLFSLLFYPTAAAYPAATWFVRFGLGGALFLIAGMVVGDAVRQGRISSDAATFASITTILGAIASIVSAIAS
ncbi:hypothetical protein ACFPK1_32300 [Actinomycetospora rhizophila]|uniref:Uncharacterized protein n=1 Tax=Actinomycetospora rhizophila TaxID=1416876 RepID=A0ABV9ZND8_9PSEU